MQIHAVATIYNEGDIVANTLSHLFENGIDWVWVAHGPSTDNTRERISRFRNVTVWSDEDDYHYQPLWINRLTQMARQAGADWVIPFDADEFWYSVDGATIRDRLLSLPPDLGLLHAKTYLHTDWDHRQSTPQYLPKVAFRPREDTIVSNGNHWVDGFTHAAFDTLGIRELQFRGLAHLNRKCEERTVRLDPSLPHTDGTHQKDLYAMTPGQRAIAWEKRVRAACVYDPIPYRGVIDRAEIVAA